jgi:hydrogenase expression/formation protein HypD
MQNKPTAFRDREIAGRISRRIDEISKEMDGVKLMHVCGTHEDTVTRFGIRSLLPENIEIISGPGCPVCVTTTKEIDEAIYLAREGVTVTTFGDMLRVPGSSSSLADAKADGCDIRVVYSITDAIKIARENPGREIVHIAIGFETTAPTTAIALEDAPGNFYVLSCHRLIPPAMSFLLDSGDVMVDGFIDPGHVSTVIGLDPYKPISDRFRIPQVIAGFEPLDVLFAVLKLLKMIKNKEHGVWNEYTRVVRDEGNPRAVDAMNRVFKHCDVKWRGFPVIPSSGLDLGDGFSGYDARAKFRIRVRESKEPKGCRCGDVLKGVIYPRECPLFGRKCNPENPVGPCMVSSEGACMIAYRYGEDA